MKNNQEQHQPNLMADDSMTPSPSTQVTADNEAPISPKLQKWVDFVELIKGDKVPVHQDREVAPFIKEAEEIRKAKAEKRLNAKLRKLEVEQKQELLAEWQKSVEEARRKFESLAQIPYDYTSGPPSSINDIFREGKEREELKALELEQKAELLKNMREQSKRECGVEWPPVYEGNEGARYDHIPKHPQFYIDMIKRAFPGPANEEPKVLNEPPAAS